MADQQNIDDAVSVLLDNLPKPVRDFVLSKERDAMILRLSQKHNLHADQAGEFERAVLHMLLGVSSPEEFVQTMKDGGIPQPTIDAITTDVNEMIFKPLQDAERKLADAPRAPAPKAPEPTPAPVVEVAPTPQPYAQPPQYPQQQAYMPPMPAPQQQTYWVPVSITAVPQPYMTTQAPYPYAQPSPAAPMPEPAPAPAPEPAPEPPKPEVHEAPAPERSVQPPPPVWTPPPPPNLPTAPSTDIPLKKEYGADPYREPV